MYSHERQVLARIASQLRRRYGKRIVLFCAFGSRARGDHDVRSDFDVLVVVEGKNPKLEYGIMEAFVEEETKAGLFFSPLIKDQTSFELERRFDSPFYQNIRKEGIAL